MDTFVRHLSPPQNQQKKKPVVPYAKRLFASMIACFSFFYGLEWIAKYSLINFIFLVNFDCQQQTTSNKKHSIDEKIEHTHEQISVSEWKFYKWPHELE